MVTVPAGGGFQPDGVRAVTGFGQRERADLLQSGHRRQPALLLLLRAEHVDRPHGQTVLHAEEGVDAAVAAGQLQGHHACRQPGQTRAAIAGDGAPDHAQLGDLRNEFERELCALPVVVDDRQHLGVDEIPDPIADLAFGVGEQLGQQVVVRPSRDGQACGEVRWRRRRRRRSGSSMLMTISPVLSVAVSWCPPRRSRTNHGRSSGPVHRVPPMPRHFYWVGLSDRRTRHTGPAW